MTTYATDGGGKFIPATQRPDGTWRKARRVKQGYVPQEEVPLYESKGKQFASRVPTLPVGYAAPLPSPKKKKKNKANPEPGIIVLPKEANDSQATTAKVTANTPAPNAVQVDVVSADTSGSDSTTVDGITKDLNGISLEDEQAELARKLKRIRKKLREIEAIEVKLKSGDLKKPEKDQVEKVKKEKQYLKELKLLEDQQNVVE